LGDKVKDILEKAKGLFKKVSKKVIIAVAAVIVVIAAIIAIVMNNQPYSVLFTGLNSEDLSAVTSYLREQGVSDYKLENNDTVLVPSSQEAQLKYQLVMEGYPKSGFGYSTYYDHVNALSTESERNAAYLMLVQDRLGAVVRCFDGVKDAVVTITQGEDRSYVLDSSNMVGASASVFVTMKDGAKLTDEQADAIRNLVTRSVQGLDVESVAISDNYGNQYSGIGETEESSDLSALKLQLEEENNNKIRTEIMQVLLPFFGEGNVQVGVNCTVDVNRTTEDSTTYTLPEGSTDGEGLIGSKVYDHSIVRGEDQTAGGTVGTETNADLPTYVEEETNPDGTEQEIHTSGQEDYQNNTSVKHEERIAGYISDCMVSVSINTDTAGNVDVNSIRTHVARAAGITDEQAASRISILPLSFYNENAPITTPIGGDGLLGKDIPTWAIYAAGGALLLFMVLMFIMILVIRRKSKKQALAAQQAAGEGILLPVDFTPEEPTEGADVMSLETEKSMELRKDIRQFADENPEIAAQMVRSLLKGGGENG
jgi:flagellar M-ring protein FliF